METEISSDVQDRPTNHTSNIDRPREDDGRRNGQDASSRSAGIGNSNGQLFVVDLGSRSSDLEAIDVTDGYLGRSKNFENNNICYFNDAIVDDEDEYMKDGREMTLDEAEDDPTVLPETHEEDPGDPRSCPYRCCVRPLVNCWSRCADETRQTLNDVKECAEQLHEKRILSRLFSVKTLKKKLPCLEWIPKYTLRHLKGDVIAGLTTGLSVLPQGLAYGVITEIPAQYGLYSSFMGSFAYAVLGTGKDVAVGPSAILSIVTAEYGTGRSPVKLDPTYAIILALFAGIIQFGMGILQLGFLFRFISLPVLKGFRAAAGITIFASRLKKWWGLQNVPRQFFPQLYWTFKLISETIVADALLGTLCLLLLYTFKKLKAMKWEQKFRDLYLPLKILKILLWILGTERNIIVVAFSGGVVYALLKSDIIVSYANQFPPGIPNFTPPNFTLTVTNDNRTETMEFWQIASDIGVGFFFVPLVGMLECISVGKAFGRKGNYAIDYNQELIALGVSNILCSFVSGHPVTGAFLRSGINFNAGVKTPAAGILAGAVVLIALTVATPILAYVPVCAMAATVMMGAIDVITFHKFGIIWKTKKIDLIPWIITFVTSLILGIEYGVLIGCGWSILVLLYTTAKSKIAVISNDCDTIVVIIRQTVTGLTFPAADSLTSKLSKVISSSGVNCKILTLDLSAVMDTDTSIIQSIKIIQDKCKKRGIKLEIVNPQPRVEILLQRTYLKEFCREIEESNTQM